MPFVKPEPSTSTPYPSKGPPWHILICGDRKWRDQSLIFETLAKYVPNIRFVVEGECRGADRMGRAAAETLGIPVYKYPANWEKHGKAAGPIRNREMLNEAPNLVLAFHDNIEESKGTKDMIKAAKKAGIEVRVISHGNH